MKKTQNIPNYLEDENILKVVYLRCVEALKWHIFIALKRKGNKEESVFFRKDAKENI